MDPIFELAIDLQRTQPGQTLVQILTRTLREAIVEGRLNAGLKMPSSRSLANQLAVSRNTVISCYENLTLQGYLLTRQGGGTYVSTLSQDLPALEDSRQQSFRLARYWRDKSVKQLLPHQPTRRFDFRVGIPETRQFPFMIWQRELRTAAREISRRLSAGLPVEQSSALCSPIADYVSLSRAVACKETDILVTQGTQQSLNLLAQVLITPGKTRVGMECPGYPMAREVFAAHGARIIDIAVDEQGIRVGQMPEDLDLVYVTPSHQFPLGMPMSPARRIELLDFAHQHQITVIEDDYDGEFRLAAKPLDALKSLDRHNNVFYLGTFSKILFPDLRTGFVIAPTWATEALHCARFLHDWQNSSQAQLALAGFIRKGHLHRYLRKMRLLYRQRHQALQESIAEYCAPWLSPIPVYAGVHMSALLDPGLDSSRLVEEAAEQQIAINSIASFSRTQPAPAGLIFGLGNIEAEQIPEAIQRLGRVLHGLAPL
ncbi:MocR-like pyridoxine biosynthesis transcription factor PdxR [Bowmanella dokdonensis]|uniref:PLP-dependent aminotransferase family protein n=1 Tax=Bowmanella dokdonensis TaxID=751969 RepID=A0A939IS70_9ALTE|nr:PLP-dependent aminotransferase family protein [Bowmanella dokdonensis]MBN7826126.1 PLP-dependent aminotransferase family protein [Bowmanella dokdonensis]